VSVRWLPNDPFRPLIEQVIEQAVSNHCGRPWAARSIRALDEFASHPSAILADDGLAVFVKVSTAVNGSEQVEIELAGLQLLSRLTGVRTPLPIGSGIVSTDGGAALVLEAIPTVERSTHGWRDIGRTLAQIHQATAESFGLDTNGYFGPLRQDNQPASVATWPAFYAERRLWPRLRAALESGNLPASVAARVEALVGRLPDLCGPEVSPTLLHGDAQQNNFLTTAAGVVVIDPAVYFGHPEVDLALVDYFRSVPADVFLGYRDVMPIDPGFEERRSLWRIFAHLAVVTLPERRTSRNSSTPSTNTCRSASCRAEKIPPVAGDVEEDDDSAVWLDPRRRDELDARRRHTGQGVIEVVDLQKETDPAGQLVSYDRHLVVTVGAGEQDARVGPGRPDDDPSFRAAIVGERGRILDQLEAEHVDEEGDRRVVLVNDDGHQVHVRHPTILVAARS
jgi:fructosamine-3-kinase